jgi:hypothetical protein
MSTDDHTGRAPRSIRLTTGVNKRLIAVCEHLGVTPSAYLIAAAGKAISADEALLIPHLHAKAMQESAEKAQQEQLRLEEKSHQDQLDFMNDNREKLRS